MQRITEIAGIVLSFDPRPIQGDWNGAGAHTNYSTKSMGEDGGYEVIKKAIEKLGLKHKEHIAAYGEGNERRLTGRHETADINTFLWSRHRESWQREPSVWTDVLQEAEKNVLKSTKAVNVVGDRRISLGPGAGCAGLATQLELGYRQACLAASRPELPIEVPGPATHNLNGECW